MADRRCISKEIYSSRRFLELSAPARDLYTYLVLYSDNDGVTEAFSVLRMTSANYTDLQLLESRGFIKILNEDWVTYITNFSTFNTLDGRGARPSKYRELLLQVLPGTPVLEIKPKKKKEAEKETTEKIEEYIYAN